MRGSAARSSYMRAPIGIRSELCYAWRPLCGIWMGSYGWSHLHVKHPEGLGSSDRGLAPVFWHTAVMKVHLL